MRDVFEIFLSAKLGRVNIKSTQLQSNLWALISETVDSVTKNSFIKISLLLEFSSLRDIQLHAALVYVQIDATVFLTTLGSSLLRKPADRSSLSSLQLSAIRAPSLLNLLQENSVLFCTTEHT